MRTRTISFRTVAALLALLVVAATASAQTSRTWDGSSSTAWNVAANWTPSGVPATIDHVAIPNTTNKPVLSANVTVANFSITGGELDLDGHTMTVNGTMSMTGGTVKDGLMQKTSSGALTITGVTVNCALDVASNTISINTSRFKQQVHITKNGGSSSNSMNGNVWEASTWMNNAYVDGSLLVGSTSPDTFLLDLHLTNAGKGITLGNTTGSNAAVIAGNGLQQLTVVNTSGAGVSCCRLTINKPTGYVQLTGDLVIANYLNLTKGIVEVASGGLVTVNSAATVSSTSNISHINGPVLKKGNQAFTFPVGRNGAYRPITITAPTTSTHSFRAEYFEKNSNALYSHASKDASLNHLNKNEYWTLTRVVGTSTPKVTLSWDTLTSCIMSTPLSAIHVAGWNGTTWKDLGNGATTGNIHKGTIQTTNAVATFNAFILEHDNAMSLCGRTVDFDWTPGGTISEGSTVTFNNLSANYPSHFQYVWIINDCWYLGYCGDTLFHSVDFVHTFSVGKHTITLRVLNDAGYVIGEASKLLTVVPDDFLTCACEPDIPCDFVGNGTFTGRFEDPDDWHEAANLYCWIRDPDSEVYEDECVPLEFGCIDVNGYEHQLIPDFCVGENSDSDFSIPNNMFTIGVPVYEPGETSADENSSYAVIRTWASFGLSTSFPHSYLVSKLMDGLNPNQLYNVSLDARLSNRSVRTSRINVGFTDGYLCPSTWVALDNDFSIAPTDLPGSQILTFSPDLSGGFLHGYTAWHHCETTFAASDDFTWMYIGGIYPYAEVEDPNGEYTQTHGSYYPFEYYHAEDFYPIHETRFFIDNVSITALPPVITQGAGLCRTGSPITLNVTGAGTGGNIYTWSASPADASLGTQLHDMEIEVNPSAATTVYTVTVEGPDGCLLTDQITISSDYCCMPATGSISYINATLSGTQVLTGDYAINGTMTIEAGADITFDGADVNMGPNASIIVEGTASLTITDITHIKACDNMWDMIFVPSGASITVNNESIIEDGEYALYLVDGADYTIDNANFNRNYVSIYMGPINTPVYNATVIKNSRFLCQTSVSNPTHVNLHAPMASVNSYSGIYAHNIRRLNVGIKDAGNEFNNCDYGVLALDVIDVLVHDNSFTEMDIAGIYISDCGTSGNDVDILENSILRTPYGIFCYDNPDVELKIQENIIDYTGMTSPPNVMTAITVQEITPGTISDPNLVSIYNNDIYLAPCGIHAVNLYGNVLSPTTYIGENTITNDKVPNDNQAGILTQNCTGLIINENVISNGSKTGYEAAIRVSSGNTNWLFCNQVTDINKGLFFDNDLRPSTLLVKNVMDNNQTGIFLNYAIIGNQGSATVGLDNEWYGTWNSSNPHTEVYGTGTDGTLSRFYVQNTSPYIPTVNNNTGGAFPAIPVSTASGGSTLGCDFTAPSYKTDGAENPAIAEALSMLDTDANAEVETDRMRGMRWAGEYGLYKQLLSDDVLRTSANALSDFYAQKDNGNMGLLHRALSGFNAARSAQSLNDGTTGETVGQLQSMEPVNRVEERLKEVLNILYPDAQDLKAMSDANVSRLREIAQLCPLDDGFGVYIARSTLLKFDTLPRHYVSICETSAEVSEKNGGSPQSANEGAFMVYPNPNNGDFHLNYTLLENETGTAEVYDAVGRRISIDQLTSTDTDLMVTLEAATTGLYFLAVRIDGELRFYEKISVYRK